MATAAELMRIARAEVGNTSGRKYWDWYFGGSWAYVDGDRTPYCACFVSWVLSQAGVRCPAFPSACAPDLRDDLKGRSVAFSDMRAGDVLGFDWDSDRTGDHTGFFDCWQSSTSFYAIEGNTSGGRVARRLRYVSQLVCAVRPYYEDSASPSALDVDGWVGPKTVSEWQRQVGTPVDGEISGQTHHGDQYRRNVTAIDYGTGGSQLVTAVQRRAGCDADGYWGRDTTDAIQRLLKAWGYYTGNVDHDFGKHSAESLQRSLNDGKWK